MLKPGPEFGANRLQGVIRFRGPGVQDDQDARRQLMDRAVFPTPLPLGVEDRQPGGETWRDDAGQKFDPRRVRDAAKIQFGSHPRLWGKRSVHWGDCPRHRSDACAAGDEQKGRQLKDTEQETALAGGRISHGRTSTVDRCVWELPETVGEVWGRFEILQERHPWTAGSAKDASSRILATTPGCGAS